MSRPPDPEHEPVPAGDSLAAGGTDVAAGSLPPPLEANDQMVAAVVTAVWAVALVVLLLVRGDIRSSERWWIWTAAGGVGLGLFAMAYLPHLKRSRERAALRRHEAHPVICGGFDPDPERGKLGG